MGTMEDLSGLEAVIRRIAREEIARAVGAAGAVAKSVWDDAEIDSAEEAAAQMLRRTMERVARDVLADKHPALSTEHTASTEPVHTITTVPERSRAACTCHRHTHVMGHDDRCGAPFCYCLSPVRAWTERSETCPCTVDRNDRSANQISPHLCSCGHYRHVAGECSRPPRLYAEHTGEHTGTETPSTCTACGHGEHDPGRCGMHVYRRGEAVPCPCLIPRTHGAQPNTPPNPMCTVCEHAPHGAGNCQQTIPYGEAAFQCTCGGQADPAPCSVCDHAPHAAHLCSATIVKSDGWTASCECGGRA